MIRLALIGRNIQHSKSPEVYNDLLNKEFSYTLIDEREESSLPLLKELRENFYGVSITAPYKKHYFSLVDELKTPPKIDAINCLVFKKNKIEGHNTDYLALQELIPSMAKNFSSVIVLGDGATSKVVQLALEYSGLNYSVKSRKLGNLKNLEIDEAALVINSCSREYVFSGALHERSLFWDLNYNHIQNQNTLSQMNVQYVDGLNLLYTQAKHSVVLWKIN